MPLVAERLPGVMTPVPLAKVPVRLADAPAVMAEELAVKLEMEGAAGGGVLLEDPEQPFRQLKQKRTAKEQTAAREGFMKPLDWGQLTGYAIMPMKPWMRTGAGRANAS
jgi:hypothetical protein